MASPHASPLLKSGQGKQNHGSRWRGMRLKEGIWELPSGSMVSGVERSDGHTVSGHIAHSVVAEAIHFYEEQEGRLP